MLAGLQVLHTTSNSILQSTMMPSYQLMFSYDIQALYYILLPSMAGLVYFPFSPFTSIINPALHPMSGGGLAPSITNRVDLFSSTTTPMEQPMTERLAEMKAMIQWILGVTTLLKKSQPHNYVDSPFIDSIALIELPKKFSFPNMKLYDSTTNPTDHIASYNQRMFTVTI